MEFIISIICIILIIIICIYFIFEYKDSNTVCIVAIIIIIVFSICLGGIIEVYPDRNRPSAIDVYRGNTTLEIKETIRDSVVIKRDTIVVFKHDN